MLWPFLDFCLPYTEVHLNLMVPSYISLATCPHTAKVIWSCTPPFIVRKKTPSHLGWAEKIEMLMACYWKKTFEVWIELILGCTTLVCQYRPMFREELQLGLRLPLQRFYYIYCNISNMQSSVYIIYYILFWSYDIYINILHQIICVTYECVLHLCLSELHIFCYIVKHQESHTGATILRFKGWQKTWPILGGFYLAAGVAHFTAAESFEAIYPPEGTWGFWYLPGSVTWLNEILRT